MAVFMALAAVLPAQAQESVDRPFPADALPRVEAEGRTLVVPPSRGPADTLEAASGGFAAQSFEAGARRVHLVTFEGDTFKAATPIDGPRSWITFDPERRVFESVGFAIVDLPKDLHPADAVARVRRLPGEPDAAVRVRGPRIEWR